MKRPRILIPSVGRKVVLVRALEKYFNVVVANDRGVGCSGCMDGGIYVDIPSVESPDYAPKLLSAIDTLAISAILPVRNEDMLVLDALRPEIEKCGVKLVLSPRESIEICIDKLKLWNKLVAHHFHVPITFGAGDQEYAFALSFAFPCFVKSRLGTGSRDAVVVRALEELNFLLADPHRNVVIQPYLQGQEYTVDMFFDNNSNLKQAVLRKRIAIRDGQMDVGEVCEHLPFDSFKKILRIGEVIRFAGPVNVQFILCDQACNIIDINPRFSGGIGLTIVSGADFPAYLRALVCDENIAPTDYHVGKLAYGYTNYVYA